MKYSTQLPQGVHLKHLVISNGTAFANFHSNLESEHGESILHKLHTELSKPLSRLPTVQRVVITIN